MSHKLVEKDGSINVDKLPSCLERCLIKTLNVISYMSEIRDPYTAHHQKRVAKLSLAIAHKMKLSEHEALGIYLGALIHDIGKVKVPAELLAFPGKLSSEQYSLIKRHPVDGEQIVHDIEFPWPIKEIILCHHERLDGSGYPHGLNEEKLPLSVRIVSVSDVVESISSHRPYRAAKGVSAALKHIKESSGTLYDTNVVAACNELFLEDNFNFQDDD
jgi:putative nucleotidyltransferase with HDIG domain